MDKSREKGKRINIIDDFKFSFHKCLSIMKIVDIYYH